MSKTVQYLHATPVVLEQYLWYVITGEWALHLLGFASQYSELGLHLVERARPRVMSPSSIILAIVSQRNGLAVAGTHASAMAAHAAPMPVDNTRDLIVSSGWKYCTQYPRSQAGSCRLSLLAILGP